MQPAVSGPADTLTRSFVLRGLAAVHASRRGAETGRETQRAELAHHHAAGGGRRGRGGPLDGVAGSWNPWKFGDNKKFKHWELRPMGRYWLWEAFNGHFFGVNAEYAQFNVGGMKATPFGLMFSDTDKTRYEGSYFGAGISYGYSWMLSPRWSIEGEVGVGYRQSSYRSYDCVTCGRPRVDGDPKQNKGYFGPTRLAVSVIFMIK